jgi:hypothetical protein
MAEVFDSATDALVFRFRIELERQSGETRADQRLTRRRTSGERHELVYNLRRIETGEHGVRYSHGHSG